MAKSRRHWSNEEKLRILATHAELKARKAAGEDVSLMEFLSKEGVRSAQITAWKKVLGTPTSKSSGKRSTSRPAKAAPTSSSSELSISAKVRNLETENQHLREALEQVKALLETSLAAG